MQKVDRLNETKRKKRLLRSLERMFVQEAKVHQTLMDVAAPEAKTYQCNPQCA